MKLRVATFQFAVSADVRRNARVVMAQMRTAAARRAQVAHFPEACLSGYAAVDMPPLARLDRAMAGELHSGRLVRDKRSALRDRL